MAFITLSTLVTDPFVAALCNTLVHSLWQGLLLAALTGVIIIFTRKATSATRYNLLIAALIVFTVGVGATFTIQFNLAKAVVSVNTTAPVIQLNNTDPSSFISSIPVQPMVTPSFNDKLFGYLNNNHNTIVLIWFLIICAKSIQLAVGLWGVHRLKTRQVSATSAFWTDRINQLANNLAIKQTIGLLESGLAKVPMVIGNLKPMILIPIGLLTALTTAEVEAILVHELAHIKRRDYLVNLLQSLMEIVFFFNPAVLWVSQLIKAERENCCDDLALAQSSDKVSYVRALLSCEEYQQSVPAYAMAFPGGKGSLFDRVKRIAGNRNHSLNLFEKTVLAICLVVSGLCMSAFAEKENIKRAAHAVVKAIQHIKGDVAQPQQTVVKQTKAVKEPKIQQVNPPVLTAETPMLNADTIIKKIDTNAVKDKTIARVKLQIDSGLRSMTGRLGKLNVDEKANVNTDVKISALTKVNADIKAIAKADVKTNINTNVDYNVHFDSIRNSSSMSFRSKNGERSTYKNNLTMLYKPSRITFSATTPYQSDTANKNSIYKKYPIELRHKVGKDNGKLFGRIFDSIGKADNNLKRNKLSLKLTIPNMADALYDAGLIKDKTHFTAMITNDVLLVNGIKQSEANHQLILKKYQKKPSDTVNLSFTYPGK